MPKYVDSSTGAEVKPQKRPRHPWNRQLDEPTIWYERFLIFLYLGIGRTVEECRRQYDLANNLPNSTGRTNWGRIVRRWKWWDRAYAYDDHTRPQRLREVLAWENTVKTYRKSFWMGMFKRLKKRVEEDAKFSDGMGQEDVRRWVNDLFSGLDAVSKVSVTEMALEKLLRERRERRAQQDTVPLTHEQQQTALVNLRAILSGADLEALGLGPGQPAGPPAAGAGPDLPPGGDAPGPLAKPIAPLPL